MLCYIHQVLHHVSLLQQTAQLHLQLELYLVWCNGIVFKGSSVVFIVSDL